MPPRCQKRSRPTRTCRPNCVERSCRRRGRAERDCAPRLCDTRRGPLELCARRSSASRRGGRERWWVPLCWAMMKCGSSQREPLSSCLKARRFPLQSYEGTHGHPRTLSCARCDHRTRLAIGRAHRSAHSEEVGLRVTVQVLQVKEPTSCGNPRAGARDLGVFTLCGRDVPRRLFYVLFRSHLLRSRNSYPPRNSYSRPQSSVLTHTCVMSLTCVNISHRRL
jgi:hypothetical protein